VLTNGAATQHAYAADRFAREIFAFLTVIAARSRRLNAKPLGAFIDACAALLLIRFRGTIAAAHSWLAM
jgi:hypothetical protein